MKKDLPQFFAWADVIRTLAILLVVLLHTFTITNIHTWQGFGTLLIIVFAKVSVPLFIMLSGALLLPKIETWNIFFHKRVKRVVLPWMTWTLLLYLALPNRTATDFWSILLEIFHSFSADFTFLPLIFCLYLLIPTFRIIMRAGGFRHIAYLVVIWFVGVGLLPFMRNSLAFPLSVDNGLVTQTIRLSGYILAGGLLSKVVITKRTKTFTLTLLIILVVWTAHMVQRHGAVDSIYSSYTSPMIIMSSMMLFVLLKNTIPDYDQLSAATQKLIKLMSTASFGVFLIHNAVIQGTRPFIQSIFLEPFTQNVMTWLTVCFLSFGIILLLYQIKPIRSFIT